MRKSKDFSNIEFNALIHTLQGSSTEAILSEDEIRAKPYVRRFKFSRGKAVYQINPNKYGLEIVSLADFKQIFSLILEELCITDYEIERLDIAINTAIPFDSLYKINNYLKELYAVHIRESNSYHTNGDDLRKRSLKVTNRDYELEIYDKYQESKGQDPAKTRIEFRFKRIRKDQTIDNVINTVYRDLDSLPSHIEELNHKKILQLYEAYKVEQSPDYEGRITNLPAFVAKYADFVYTMDILSGLHGKCYTGKVKNWLYRYRASGKTLTLYTKGDLVAYIKNIKSALKKYAKGHATPSLLHQKNDDGKAA